PSRPGAAISGSVTAASRRSWFRSPPENRAQMKLAEFFCVSLQRFVNASVADGHDLIGQREQLVELRRGEQDCAARSDEFVEVTQDVLLGGDVDPVRWFVEQERVKTSDHPACKDHLLLISARQGSYRQLRSFRPDVQQPDQIGDD